MSVCEKEAFIKTYTVAHLGCGGRGSDHVRALAACKPRLKLAALCDLDSGRLNAASALIGGGPALYTDVEAMLAKEKPDIFSFCTHPNARLEFVQAGVRYGVKAIVTEKPMALSVQDARALCKTADAAGVKLVVSHQHKYGGHWQKVKEIVATGKLGRVRTIHATSLGWMQHYATHLIDYSMWLNDYSPVVKVAGHIHGRDYFGAGESHPSPGYFMGHMEFANGVRGLVECGTFTPEQEPGIHFWMNAGATVVGTEGVARVIVGKGWEAVTRDGVFSDYDVSFDGVKDSIPLHLEVADWLDDKTRLHCCRGELACHGFEVMMAICLSGLEHKPVDLPLWRNDDVTARMLAEVPA